MWSFSVYLSVYTILTFSLTGSTLWLPFGTRELPASLFLCFGAVMKYNKGYLLISTAVSNSRSVGYLIRSWVSCPWMYCRSNWCHGQRTCITWQIMLDDFRILETVPLHLILILLSGDLWDHYSPTRKKKVFFRWYRDNGYSDTVEHSWSQ